MLRCLKKNRNVVAVSAHHVELFKLVLKGAGLLLLLLLLLLEVAVG
jgi:hypothetical protein